MKKITRIILAGLGLGLVTFVFAFFNSRPAPAQLPPPPVPVKVTNTPLPVQGAVNANVTNTVPISGTINANLINPPLLPLLPSNTITLSGSSLISPGCGPTNTAFEQFSFNTFVAKNSGILEPFTLPAGQVPVVTNFSWVAYGSTAVANQVRVASLSPVTTTGGSGADAQSTALADSTGRAGGSQDFPTGIVIQNPAFFCLDLQPVVSGEMVSGLINGFLAPDR